MDLMGGPSQILLYTQSSFGHRSSSCLTCRTQDRVHSPPFPPRALLGWECNKDRCFYSSQESDHLFDPIERGKSPARLSRRTKRSGR